MARKQSNKKKLSSKEVLNFTNNADCPILISSDGTILEIFTVTFQEQKFVFYTYCDSNKVVILDTNNFDAKVFKENGVIHFIINGKKWRLKDADANYILGSVNEEEELEPHEIKACFQRADELEKFMNLFLDTREGSSFNVLVHFCAVVQYDKESYLIDGEPRDYFLYYFEVYLMDNKGYAMTNRRMVLLLDTTNDEATEKLIRDLIDPPAAG